LQIVFVAFAFGCSGASGGLGDQNADAAPANDNDSGAALEASPADGDAGSQSDSGPANDCTDNPKWFEGSFAKLPELSADIVSVVEDSALHPNSYTIPSAIRIAAFETLIDEILDAVDEMWASQSPDWCAIAADGASAGYLIFRLYEANSKRYFIFGKDAATQGEQPSFFVNPEAKRNIVLEAPHAINDTNSEIGTARMFVSDLAPRAAIFSGAARCSLSVLDAPPECAGETPVCAGNGFPRSDMAHNIHSLFHSFHEKLNDRAAPLVRTRAEPTKFAQLHTANAEPVISTGTSDPNQSGPISNTIRGLVAARISSLAPVHSCNDGDDGTSGDSIIGVVTNNECADFNPQALYTNVARSLACTAQNPLTASNRFIQVEGHINWTSSDTSADGTAADVGWFQVMDAIRDPTAWGTCDLTCAGGTGCVLGSAQASPPAQSCN
jgi:hypothetical protein